MKNKFTLLCSLLIFISCEAPRENPFDPASVNYKAVEDDRASTQLFVHSLYTPYTGIPNVMVGESNTSFFGITNAAGKVSWKHDKKDSLFFILNAEGYFPDSILFTGNGMTNNLETALNAIPQVSEIKMNSFYLNFDETFQDTYLSVSTIVKDNDGVEDVHSVILKEPDKSFSDTLKLADALEKRYEESGVSITTIDPNMHPSQLPELNFVLIVKDQNGDSVLSHPLHIQRVIEEQIVLSAPLNNTTHQDSVVFEWESVSLDYPFSYTIMLERLEDSAKFAYSGIPSTETNYTIKDITPGTYYWRVWIVDNLGNICQSIILSFKYVQ